MQLRIVLLSLWVSCWSSFPIDSVKIAINKRELKKRRQDIDYGVVYCVFEKNQLNSFLNSYQSLQLNYPEIPVYLFTDLSSSLFNSYSEINIHQIPKWSSDFTWNKINCLVYGLISSLLSHSPSSSFGDRVEQ